MAPKKKPTRGRTRKADTSDIEDETPLPGPPRPFNNVEGLPLSIEEPEYNLLNNPLSLKNSAVLYSSLMKSRRAYVSGNIFDLYWAKGKTKFENDTNARDRMNKLCDCGMEIGPHSFDVRFFILKDDEIEKKRQEEKDKKKEKRAANKKLREEKKRLRESKKAKLAEGKIEINPEASKDGATQEPKTNEEEADADADDDDDDDDDSSSSDDNDDNDDDDGDTEADQREVSETQDDSNTKSTEAVETKEGSAEVKDAMEETKEVAESNGKSESTEVPETKEDNKIETEVDSKSTEIKTDAKQLQQSEESKKATPKDKPLPPLQVSKIKSPKEKKPKAKPIKQQSQDAPASTDPMQTPESQMMIANLNAIARVDPSLNSLMKIVATGTARPDQIREFQGYIQRAKAMGPSPYYKQTLQTNQQQNQTAGSSSSQTPVKSKTPKVKKPKPPKPPKKAKPPKENLLTTFQEMYVNGSDLVFEFTENPNIRFNLPKDCIIEKISPNEILVSFLVIHNRGEIKRFRDRQKAKKERLEKLQKEKEKGATGAEADEEEGQESKKDEVQESEKQQEAAKETKTDATKETESTDSTKETEPEPIKEVEPEAEIKEEKPEDLPVEEQPKKAKRGRPRNTDRKAKKEENLANTGKELLEEPIPYYSAISFKLTSVSNKYDPIFVNSFNKYDDVKAYMEKILEEGIRVPKTFVWYSVDAYDDEELAEALRHQLFLIENPPKGKYKKRSMEDSLILNKPGTPATKKAKTE